MRQELQLELQSQFAFMKPDMSLENRYQKYGCECGDGWFELIQELCKRITNVYKFEGIDDIDIEILQIKEKFGSLRFYYRHFGDSNTIQAIDFLGVGSIRLPASSEECEYKKKISELVRSYEKWSAKICENCGERGELRTDLIWKKTLCEDCYQAMIESN